EPDTVDAGMLARRPEQRNDDEGDLEEVQEEREHEHEEIDENQEAYGAARQADQKALDPAMAVDPVEGQREYPCADQDEDHEGGELGGGFRCLAHQVPAQPTFERAERERPGGADRAAVGRGG